MANALITDSTTESLRPLGSAAQRSFELITGAVMAAEGLGARHVNLFAEPVASTYGDNFDWYAPLDGPSQPLGDLPADVADAVRADLAALVGDIRAEAARLRASGGGEGVRLGDALDNAVQYPDEGSVFVITNPDGTRQPVLVHWGWVSEATPEVRGSLAATDRVQPVPPAAVLAGAGGAAGAAAAATSAQEARPARSWGRLWWTLILLGWLALLGLVLAIVYLLIEPCALRTSWLPGNCPTEQAARPPVLADTDVLRDRLAALQHDLYAMDHACQPVHLPPIPDPVAELPQVDEDQARLDQSGATMGALTFSLLWGSRADLDLHVTCPNGQSISFNRRAACGGQLDVDSNAQGTALTREPVENTFFSAPAVGNYQIRVNYFSGHDDPGSQSFRLRIRDGDRIETVEGTVGPLTRDAVINYTYGGN